MKVVLIDDEEIAIEVLEILLDELEGMEIVGRFTNTEEAMDALESLEVDVVFLDIEMGGTQGLRFAEEIIAKKLDLEIVFVTAYSQYAVEAFEVNAIDYLLKPVKKKRLEKTILKIQEKKKALACKRKLTQSKEQKLMIYSLGSFRLLDFEQNPVKWRTKKGKELFAYLWHHKEHPYRNMKIMEELWPDAHRDKAAKLLYTTVYQVRKTLKEMGYTNAIHLINEEYRLEISLESDLEQLKQVLRSLDTNDFQVSKILKLYQGNYLEEEDYSWAIYERQRLKQSLLEHFEKYIKHMRRQKKVSPLMEASLEKMLQIDPYNEKYAYLLLEYYGKINNKMKLIHFYESFRNRIEEEIGINLPRDIKKLYHKYIYY